MAKARSFKVLGLRPEAGLSVFIPRVIIPRPRAPGGSVRPQIYHFPHLAHLVQAAPVPVGARASSATTSSTIARIVAPLPKRKRAGDVGPREAVAGPARIEEADAERYQEIPPMSSDVRTLPERASSPARSDRSDAPNRLTAAAKGKQRAQPLAPTSRRPSVSAEELERRQRVEWAMEAANIVSLTTRNVRALTYHAHRILSLHGLRERYVAPSKPTGYDHD